MDTPIVIIMKFTTCFENEHSTIVSIRCRTIPAYGGRGPMRISERQPGVGAVDELVICTTDRRRIVSASMIPNWFHCSVLLFFNWLNVITVFGTQTEHCTHSFCCTSRSRWVVVSWQLLNVPLLRTTPSVRPPLLKVRFPSVCSGCLPSPAIAWKMTLPNPLVAGARHWKSDKICWLQSYTVFKRLCLENGPMWLVVIWVLV